MDVKHRGVECRLDETPVEELLVGDVVIGPCGHERKVSRVVVDDETSVVKVSFKNTAKSWSKPIGNIVFVVDRA